MVLPEVRQDFEKLLNALLPFAKQMLQERGEFFPFGASLSADGEAALVAGYAGGEGPIAQDIISLLHTGFRKEAADNHIKAAGVCFQARVIPPGQKEKIDAIQASLEHSLADPVDVFVPYSKGFFGKMKFGGMFSGKGDRRIFGAV
jgi:hypothetical protein